MRKKKTSCKKNDPCAKKSEPLCKKMTLCKKMSLGKKPFRKKLIFFVDKLNIIDFNIFKMLKLIFTCESIAYLLQNSFVNVRFQLNSIFLFVFDFDCLFEDWSVVCLLYFVLSLLDTLFYSLP